MERFNPEHDSSNHRDERDEKLKKLRGRSEREDVTYDAQRFFPDEIRKGDPEIMEILRRGLKSEAVRWLRSATKDGMKFGTDDKKERMRKAGEYAQKAGKNLEDLAKEYGIELEFRGA